MYFQSKYITTLAFAFQWWLREEEILSLKFKTVNSLSPTAFLHYVCIPGDIHYYLTKCKGLVAQPISIHIALSKNCYWVYHNCALSVIFTDLITWEVTSMILSVNESWISKWSTDQFKVTTILKGTLYARMHHSHLLLFCFHFFFNSLSDCLVP